MDCTLRRMKLKKYKVLVIGSSTPHIRNFVNRIKDQFEIAVISNNNEFIPEGITFYNADFSIRKLFNILKTPKKLREIIKEFSPDVVYAHQANSYALYSIIANKRKLPLILTLWGSDILLHPRTSFLNKKIAQYALKNADIITSDSEFMAEEAQKLVPDTSLYIRIANFGVEALPVSIKKKKIIYSNRNHNPLYRIDQIIYAFSRFADNKNEDWKLIIAGRGSETTNLKELVKQLNLSEKVSFIGFVNQEENAENYAKATFFVSIPESDATAMSLLEAMYFKCIPVLSDLPANGEWVTNKNNGIIIHDLSTDYFEEALAINIEAAGETNRKIIEEKGTVEVSKKIFTEIILEALEKKRNS